MDFMFALFEFFDRIEARFNARVDNSSPCDVGYTPVGG